MICFIVIVRNVVHGKTNYSSKRKTRSDKFPLTLHKTGQFCKKIKGKLYYLGTDKQQALQRYLEQDSSQENGKNDNCLNTEQLGIKKDSLALDGMGEVKKPTNGFEPLTPGLQNQNK
jgi:hypothetical protein